MPQKIEAGKIKLAIPSKGRLSDQVTELLNDAGLNTSRSSDRTLSADLGDEIEAIYVRSQDIAEFVADGAADIGITGMDLMIESGRELESLLDLKFGKCRLVIAAPEGSSYKKISDIVSGTRVATSFPRLTVDYFGKLGITVEIVPLSGSTEVAPYMGIADVIVDLTSSGSTLRMNRLIELGTIIESSAQVIAKPSRKDDLVELTNALESVIQARGQRYVMANLPKSLLEKLQEVLPGITAPTVTNLWGVEDRVAVHAVVPDSEIYKTVNELKALGATGILVTRIERLS